MNRPRVPSVRNLFISPATSLREAMQVIDRAAAGVALVVDGDDRLIATLTDGDVRRALLCGATLEAKVAQVLAMPGIRRAQSVSAPRHIDRERALALMQRERIRQLPLLDSGGRVVELLILDDLLPEPDLDATAVVMAGGYGTRLRPLTERVPKPMLPVGDRPLLEHIVAQLRDAGIRRILLTTHYRPEVIATHFGDGRRFGVEIHYVVEDKPLGTAGSLGLMRSKTPVLVMNGDILTTANFRALLAFHREHQADLTVAVRPFTYRVPYGVVETVGVRVQRVVEKPAHRVFVSAGIYLLQPEVCGLVPNGERYDMPQLIQRLIDEGRRVVSFPIHEYWKDIGQLQDYQDAVSDLARSGTGHGQGRSGVQAALP